MIIKSILDDDMYKFTMQNAVVKHYPNTIVEYRFKNRNPENNIFTHEHVEEIQREINAMATLSLTEKERKFLEDKAPYLDGMYLDFLSGYRFDPSEVTMTSNENNELELSIMGPWYRTILWEVPLMAIISEVYLRSSLPNMPETMNSILTKRNMSQGSEIKVADFGTRRRRSYEIHRLVIENLHDVLVGTSNVHLAEQFDITPIGTHAHEWFMFHGAKYGYQSATYKSLEKWSDTYRGSLGIALTDTYTTDVFLQDFDMYFAKLFDGVRHDSGDPIEFGEKIIEHYKSLGIDPMSKTIVFSDGLNVPKAVEITEHFRNKIKTSFGIGTNLTNDTGVIPLNMVIKLSGIYDRNSRKIHAVKLSDNVGKNTSDSQEAIENCKFTLGLQ